MDANKRIKLIQIGYSVQKTCDLCTHSRFFQGDWGVCCKHTYDHLKHSPVEAPRGLSIHKAGVCSDFEQDDGKIDTLHAFQEFLPSDVRNKNES